MSRGPRTRHVVSTSLPQDVIDAMQEAVRAGRATSKSDALTRMARDGMIAAGMRGDAPPPPPPPPAQEAS